MGLHTRLTTWHALVSDLHAIRAAPIRPEPRYTMRSVSHAIPLAAGHVVQYVQYLNRYTIEV